MKELAPGVELVIVLGLEPRAFRCSARALVGVVLNHGVLGSCPPRSVGPGSGLPGSSSPARSGVSADQRVVCFLHTEPLIPSLKTVAEGLL